LHGILSIRHIGASPQQEQDEKALKKETRRILCIGHRMLRKKHGSYFIRKETPLGWVF
jgi:hypothetical protein